MAFKTFVTEKLWPFLAGAGSVLVMVLAFFIPSLQDQYDRYQSRKIITQYETLGNEFFNEERYDMAEQAYQKAFELSDSKRLDIEIKRLSAKINQVNLDPKWGGTLPEELTEIDFQYVLHLQQGKGQEKEKAATLNTYGIFLSNAKRFKDAEAAFKESILLDTSNAMPFINLGNLYDQQGKKTQALQQYQQAISLDKDNARAHYNLGLLYSEQANHKAAQQEFHLALQADTTDLEVKAQYEQATRALEKDSIK
ncbi:MAG: tetratricopeptide repeat protein [Niastella sp.]|nr:tetratricopeptide repeat protein [Niastella sp.]